MASKLHEEDQHGKRTVIESLAFQSANGINVVEKVGRVDEDGILLVKDCIWDGGTDEDAQHKLDQALAKYRAEENKRV